jgi:hypothetical protein
MECNYLLKEDRWLWEKVGQEIKQHGSKDITFPGVTGKYTHK